MFQIADLLAIVAGVIAGAVAFLPFVFTLKPVLDDKQNADMLKGMVSLAVSAIALLVFTLVVFVLFGEAFRMFLLGEAIGFVALWLPARCVSSRRCEILMRSKGKSWKFLKSCLMRLIIWSASSAPPLSWAI